MTQRYNEAGFPVRSGTPEIQVMVGRWPIGSTGAVGTKVRGRNMTLTRTGVGAYTLQLTGSASGTNAAPVALMGCDIDVFVNDADPTNDTDGHYVKKLALSSTGSVTFQCQDEGGTVREAPSGAVICIRLWVCNGDIS